MRDIKSIYYISCAAATDRRERDNWYSCIVDRLLRSFYLGARTQSDRRDTRARARVRDLLPEDVRGGEEALGDEHRVPRVPLLTLELDHRCTRQLTLVLFLHPIVSYHPERYRGYVERVRHEVDYVPHVMHVFLQTHVPQLLDLRPDQSRHPGQYKPASISLSGHLVFDLDAVKGKRRKTRFD